MWATVHGLASLHLHGALVPTTGQPDVDVLVDIATDLMIPTVTEPSAAEASARAPDRPGIRRAKEQ